MDEDSKSRLLFGKREARKVTAEEKKRLFWVPLAPKERETWKLIAQGLTSRQVAKKRRVLVGTVESVK
jgi:DNA-binding NarL/FixJ family response regulator